MPYLIKDELTSHALDRTIRFVLERARARKAAEEQWITLFRYSPVPKVLSEAESARMLEVNDAFTEMFDRSREELLGASAVELGLWAEPDRRRELIEKVRSEGHFENEEADSRDAEGRTGRMLLACRWLEMPGGNRLLWSVQDISERVARERALAERAKEQSCLYDVSRLLHEDDRPLTRRLQAVADRLPAGWQYPAVTVARVRVTDAVYRSEDFEAPADRLEADLEVEGEVVGDVLVGYTEERPEEDLGPFLVEERRLLEELAEQLEIELSRQKTRQELAQVVETMNEAMTIAAPDGTITFANSAARRLFSPGEEGYVGRDLTDFASRVTTLAGEPYPTEELPFQTVVRTGEPVEAFEHAIDRSDGQRKVVSVNAAPIHDEDRLQGVVLTVRDVTEQHRAAEWRHLLESSVEAAAHGIVITDRDGEIVWANPAFTEVTGYEQHEAVGENLRILNSGEQDDPFYEELWETILAGETWEGELLNRRKDGSVYPERQSIVPVRHRSEEITHFVAIKEDVSDERARQRELRETTDRLHRLLDTAAGIIFRVRLSDLGISYVTPNVEKLTGHPPERWTENPRFWMNLVPDEDLEKLLLTAARVTNRGATQVEEEYRLRHADGTFHWYRGLIRVEFDDQGEPVAFVGTSVDVTERRKLEEQLRHQALHDPLTGLANRTLLEDRLEQAVSRARRRDEGIAVLMLDLDRFKQINESLGHTAGDRVLETVGRRLQEAVRTEDTVARWGGDEFCVLLTDLMDQAALARARDRVLGRVREKISVTGQALEVDVSTGAVTLGLPDQPDHLDVERPTDLIRYADRALGEAKEKLQGEFHLYRLGEEGPGDGDPLAREQELRRALEDGELLPFYQPVVDLETGEVWGIEPLARWRHPERGLVGPGEFIPLAEETGLIHRLGRQIVDQACREVASWPESDRLRLTLNVSGRQFDDEGLVEFLARCLADTSLTPERMFVEVTETSIMRAVHRIEELHELGVSVVIDDFGTGYSSMLYLRDLPVDGLKIDMSFVQGLGQGRGNSAIVETTLTLGREMGLVVIAEGIETADQLGRLRGMGCELGQGFLFARPMPADETQDYLNAGVGRET